MKKILSFLLLLSVVVNVNANPRSVDEARMEARGFLVSAQSSRTNRVAANPSLSLVHTIAQKTSVAPAAYVFQSGADQGFVIVSAEDACTSILGYAENGHFDADHIPANLQIWLQHYAEEIEWAANHPEAVTASSTMQTSGRAVSPLLGNIKWGQDAPFNNLCPIDSDNRRSVTGCVATAAAQIMRYWQYPTQGTGSLSYEWKRTNGSTATVSANFGATTYDWSNMRPSYAGSYTTAEANAVATLMYHAGVACEMDYSSQSSGANSATMCKAMQTYFGYDAAMSCYNADYEGYAVLAEKIQEELEANRPVMIGGATPQNEGHCFVCEGSDGNGNFYINWGWDGSCDGYYPLSALAPSNQGTGGASSGMAFTVRVTAYTGIQPNQGGTPTPSKMGAKSVKRTSAKVTTKTSQISFSLEDLQNIGMSDWQGYILMAVYDSNGTFVDYISDLEENDLPSAYYWSTFNVVGNLSDLADGQYVLRPAYTISGSSGIHLLPIQNGPDEFTFTVSGNVVNFAGEAIDQEAQYTIIFKDSDTSSDSGTQLTTANSTKNQIIQQSDIAISSYTCGYIYQARDNYGLKFGSSSKDGFLTLNLGQEIIVDSINIEIGGYSASENNFILQGTTLSGLRAASAGFETRTVKLGGARLSSLTLQSTKRAYVKSLTIYTTDVETEQANFDFTRAWARCYYSNYGTILYLRTNEYVLDNDGVVINGTLLALDFGTENPYSIVGTYVLGEGAYAPGVLHKDYSYLSYGGGLYYVENGVVTVTNNNKNQYEILYNIQCEDGKSYTGTITKPISDILLYDGNSNTTTLNWEYEPVVAWNCDRANAEIATLPVNAPTIHTYLVKGVISQINSIGTSNVAQFYISQDGTTSHQIYCYNARYLNNAIFTGGEIAVGDTVVMYAKLENYNGTPELMGYVFKHYPYIDPARYTPHDLAVIVADGELYFSWECELGRQFELEVTRLADSAVWVFDCNENKDTLYVSGASNEFAWRVRTVDENGNPLSEWVSGENFTYVKNPYEPSNLQYATTDGHNFMFTWEMDAPADHYLLYFWIGEDRYAVDTVYGTMATKDFALVNTYSWAVVACDADNNILKYTYGDDFTVTSVPDYSIKNLTAVSNGLTISATWDSPAPVFRVDIDNANNTTLYSDLITDNNIQYTVTTPGTYYVWVRAVNAEQTYYLTEWAYTTVVVTASGSTTGIEDAAQNAKPVKMIINNQIVIVSGKHIYDVKGQRLR